VLLLAIVERSLEVGRDTVRFGVCSLLAVATYMNSLHYQIKIKVSCVI
jgi:hypothetical protein